MKLLITIIWLVIIHYHLASCNWDINKVKELIKWIRKNTKSIKKMIKRDNH